MVIGTYTYDGICRRDSYLNADIGCDALVEYTVYSLPSAIPEEPDNSVGTGESEGASITNPETSINNLYVYLGIMGIGALAIFIITYKKIKN